MYITVKRALAASAVVAALAACAPAAGDVSVAVSSTDTECIPDTSSVLAGAVTFVVTNDGTAETEMYVLDADGDELAEVEHIGPGVSRSLTVDLVAGTYYAGCKPGMAGDPIRAEITVLERE